MDYGHFPIADFRERFETVAFDPKNAGKDLLVLMMETYAEMLGISLDSVVRWVEKTPANRRFIPEILERFPHAKLLITMRDPRAILAAQIHRGERGRSGQLARRVVNGRNWLGGMALSRVDAALWLRAADVASKPVAPLGTPDPGGRTEAVFQVPLLLGARQIARSA